MWNVHAIAIGTTLFLAESVFRYWLIAKSWEFGRAVAWGLDREIRLSAAERLFRL